MVCLVVHQSQEKFYWKSLLSFGLGFYLKSTRWYQSSKRRNWEETRHSKMAFFPAIRGRRKGKQRVIGPILWALWNHRGFDLVGCPWCEKCIQAIPRETKLCRRQIVFPEEIMCKYSKSHFCGTPSADTQATALQLDKSPWLRALWVRPAGPLRTVN